MSTMHPFKRTQQYKTTSETMYSPKFLSLLLLILCTISSIALIIPSSLAQSAPYIASTQQYHVQQQEQQQFTPTQPSDQSLERPSQSRAQSVPSPEVPNGGRSSSSSDGHSPQANSPTDASDDDLITPPDPSSGTGAGAIVEPTSFNITRTSPTTLLEMSTSAPIITTAIAPTTKLSFTQTNTDRTTTATTTTTTTPTTSSLSFVHPLLIYSIRYEIRSYDLSANLSTKQSSLPASNSAFIDQHHFPGKHSPSKTLIAGLKNTIGLDFYYSDIESYIFWTDVIEERIYKGTIVNGSITNVDMVVQTGLSTAEGLAVDWIGLNIYWVESTLDHIEVANVNGSSRRTLIAGDMESPRAIALDPRYGLLFWSDWDKKVPRIERATMSGEDRKTIVHIKEVNGGWPNGLTLDYEALKIYWIDANSDSIHVVDYDGNNHRPLLKKIKSLGHPFSITLFENNLYWTDWKTNSVSIANKNNGSDARELQRLTSRLFDIKVFHPSRQPRIEDRLNPCFINNGNCSHLCLLSTNHTRKCDCPHLMKLAHDGLTCRTDERVLLIGRTNEIRTVDIDEPLHHIMAPISVPKVFNPRQFDYDSKTKSIYWADSQTNEVKRAQLAGTNIETIIDVIIESPSGLALDWISGNIYVTSAAQHKTPGKIYISNLNGEYISILMDSVQGIISPKSLAIHPLLGLLFCIDENENSEPIIFVAGMDGRDKHIIAPQPNGTRLENPSNLAIDLELNRVYWINQASKHSDNATIQYYDIFRDEIVTIFDEAQIPASQKMNPSVISVDGDYLIMSRRIPTEAIVRASKHDMADRLVFKTQSLDQVSALKVYNTSSQVGSNACSHNNGGCSQLCVPTSPTHRSCKCTMGYSVNPWNETECKGRDTFLIFSYSLGMKGISLDANSSSDDYYLPPIHKAFRASSIDYVHRDNLIYWVDNEEGTITKINRDTTNYQIIVQGLESEECIGIDWVAGNIYWLDPYYDIIEVARLNGSNRYVIVSGDMDKANGIVVNPIKGYIVWSDIGSVPKIETARLDGSNRRVVVNTHLTHVDDLAIDHEEDYIYWVDSTLALVERIKEDGRKRQTIYNGGSNQGLIHHLVSIAIYGDHLYIADSVQNAGSIIRLNKFDGSDLKTIQQNLGESIRDIAIFARQPLPTPDENPCVQDNGGCQDLCLYMGSRGSKRCICSHGKLEADGLRCRPYDTFILYSKLSQIDSLHIQDYESLNNSPFPSITTENRSNIVSLAVDYDARRVIYSEIARNQICSILFDGTDRRVLVEKQSLVEGIAFAHDKLYWTSIQDNSISRFNTTSLGVPTKTCDAFGQCKTAVVEKIIKLSRDDKPRGIAVDSCTSYIYWTNWNNDASIQRASPHNGYKVESIIKTNIKVPNGIAIDQARRKLYWCDARLDKIESCDMDGFNRRVLIAASPQHPFALAIYRDSVFWTDWLARGVFRADKYTGLRAMQIKKVAQRPMGIAVVASDIQECHHDQCNINNGGCPPKHTCITREYTGGTGGIGGGEVRVECQDLSESVVRLPQGLVIPMVHRNRHNNSGNPKSWPGINYHEIMMDRLDRFAELAPIEMSTSTIAPTSIVLRPPSSSPAIESIIPSHSTPIVSETPVQRMNQSGRPYFIQNVKTKQAIPANAETTTSTFRAPSSSPAPSIITTVDGVSQEQLTNRNNSSPVPVLSSSTPPPQPAAQAPPQPCQIIPSTQQPTLAAVSPNYNTSECVHMNNFKCYLSEGLVCIAGDKRCDGIQDCPSKEDENNCDSTKLPEGGQFSLQKQTGEAAGQHRFVVVILVILAAALAALFLVFGNRGRRRWFVGSNGAFSHRKLFDDNGTNIEISNPMFEEDDSANLVHCAFSIDLNERTTNFSNPLYERQVLLVNDKTVTSN